MRVLSSDNFVRILYPDNRVVDINTVIGWAQDSYSDNAPKYKCKEHGTVTVAEYQGKPVTDVLPGEFAASDPNNPCSVDCYDREPIYDDGSKKPEDIFEAIEWLTDTGEVSFPKNPFVVEDNDPIL